ncbi:PIR protein [Plasmodium vivax]|uniref:VIR protein n=1 Tax=Plasmodium vivax TaxID=5855 RepID=A0A565A3C7_PLAVI|nr:PIR protein [Plasmodium vivax]
MTKPVIAEVSADALEKVSQDLGLNKLFDGFYVKKSSSTFFKECDALNDYEKTHPGVKELCTKLISSLEKLAEMKTKDKDYYDRCNYLPHWLFDEIGKIYKSIPSKNSDNLPFFSKLSHIGNKVNRELTGNKCTTLPISNSFSLATRKNRKNSYIYLQKYNEIKQIINDKGKGKCNQYITYLQYIDSLHKKYKTDDCRVYLFLPTPNYADCYSKYEPSKLIPILNNCKDEGSKGGGNRGTGWWFSGFLGSSTGSSQSSKDNAPAGTAKAGSTVGDKGRPEASKGVAGIPDSRGLTSSTSLGGSGSQVEARPSARPVVAAAGGGLPGQLATAQAKVNLITTTGKSNEQVVHAASSYNSGPGGNALPEPTASPAGALESVSYKLDSNFYRNIIMAAAILGTIFFLFYYNMSSGLKSRFPKRKRKKKIFEHNYYEEYEKELEKYGSENESLDSQSDRYYLNYQPERDYDY